MKNGWSRLAWIGRTVALLALAACVSMDLSFKSVTFENAPQDKVFLCCREIVTAHYFGTVIRSDPATGRIETDPVEEALGREARRQQCYVKVGEADGRVVVEVMATLAKLDPARLRSDPANPWVVYASDVTVEGKLLDEITGRVLSIAPDARVVGNTLPAGAPGR